MWLFTPDGFFSAVQHKDDANKIMIRTRSKMHAERLIDSVPDGADRPNLVETPPPADYRFRITVTREQWVYMVAGFAADIDYLNFKNSAATRNHPKGFMSALHGVWSKLLGFQDDQFRNSKKGRWSTISHGGDNDPFGPLDEWLGRGSGTVNESVAASDDEFEYIEVELQEGMYVRRADDPDKYEGEVLSVNHEDGTALVHFVFPQIGDEEEEDVVKLPMGDLIITFDPIEGYIESIDDDVGYVSDRPVPDTYESIEDYTDDGSYPPPEPVGFLRGR